MLTNRSDPKLLPVGYGVHYCGSFFVLYIARLCREIGGIWDSAAAALLFSKNVLAKVACHLLNTVCVGVGFRHGASDFVVKCIFCF